MRYIRSILQCCVDILSEAPKMDKVPMFSAITAMWSVDALEETVWINKQSIVEVNMEPFNATRTCMGDE